jgi:hypothetical protein
MRRSWISAPHRYGRIVKRSFASWGPMTDSATLLKEVDARFWSLGYKPGQKLDPRNPQDKKMIPVWESIHKKVLAEDRAGKLVLTHLHPEVAQHLSDAEVANRAAAAHLDAASKASDPWDVQANVAAATTASQISSQKAREAAGKQPPSVSPEALLEAFRSIAGVPPSSDAPAVDQIAHAQAQGPTSKVPLEVIYQITDQRFWQRTHYKPGQRLNMAIPEDRQMARTWREILHEVQREANEGRLVPPSSEPLPSAPQVPISQPMPPRPSPGVMPPFLHPPTHVPTRPMPPMRPMGPPIGPSVGPMGPQGAAPSGAAPAAPPTEAAPPSVETPPTEEPTPSSTEAVPEPLSTGKIALIVLGLAAAAGVTYVVTRRAPPPRRSARSRSPAAFAFPSSRSPRS